MQLKELPIPPHFQSDKVGEVWKVDYEPLAISAQKWAREFSIRPASEDTFKTCLMPVDVQNTFCIPGYELYVGGRNGTGAVDDNRRLCEFIYRNLSHITQIVPTMDTHQAIQIFHGIFFTNESGEHPSPFSLITEDDISEGRWKFNETLCQNIGHSPDYIQRHLHHYTKKLKSSGKYDLTIWPYHAMLGSIGHALVASVEEAIFYHTISRYSQPQIQIKGHHPLTEHYSVLGPEVGIGPDGKPLVDKNEGLLKRLFEFDAIIIAGQAKSHCVAWTIADLLNSILKFNPQLVEKIYLLEDCSSPVVIPNVIDYTDDADAAFERFKNAGMHVVRSTDPVESWPGIV